MTGRKIFFIIILACIGTLTLIGAYKWRENHISQREMELQNQSYFTQMEEVQKEDSAPKTLQEKPVISQPANSAHTRANPASPAISQNMKSPTTTDSVKDRRPGPTPAPANTTKNEKPPHANVEQKTGK